MNCNYCNKAIVDGDIVTLHVRGITKRGWKFRPIEPYHFADAERILGSKLQTGRVKVHCYRHVEGVLMPHLYFNGRLYDQFTMVRATLDAHEHNPGIDLTFNEGDNGLRMEGDLKRLLTGVKPDIIC